MLHQLWRNKDKVTSETASPDAADAEVRVRFDGVAALVSAIVKTCACECYHMSGIEFGEIGVCA